MAWQTRLLGSNAQYSRLPLGRFVADMAAMGFTRLDFVPQTPHYWLGHTEGDPPDALLAALEGAGLSAAVVTPPAYRYSITAAEGPQREATLAYYRNALRLAAALGAGRLVLGAAGACWDVGIDTLWANARAMLQALCTEAQRQGVTLLLCPVMGPQTPLMAEAPLLGTLADIAGMLEEVNHPALAAALDTNVMSAAGEDIPGWFARLGGSIRLVRLADGNYHGWRAMGEGCLPMQRYRRQLADAGYSGDISLLLPGERYINNPRQPDTAALALLAGREGGQ